MPGGAASRRVLLLGVGNTLYGDDGAGYCLVKAVEACGGVEGASVEAVQRLNPGHFSLLEGYDAVVFVDAALLPDMPEDAEAGLVELDPGRLSEEEVAEIIRATDPHGMDPVRLLVLGYATGVYRGRGLLVAVRPRRIEFMEGLSGEVVEALSGKALRMLGEALERLGARLRADPGCVSRWLRERCKGPVME